MRLMKQHTPPEITSFVIRFIVDQPQTRDDAPSFRGAIRHVQSEKELNFRNWQDAVEFINGYIPIESKNDKDKNKKINAP